MGLSSVYECCRVMPWACAWKLEKIWFLLGILQSVDSVHDRSLGVPACLVPLKRGPSIFFVLGLKGRDSRDELSFEVRADACTATMQIRSSSQCRRAMFNGGTPQKGFTRTPTPTVCHFRHRNLNGADVDGGSTCLTNRI